jgi:hypothetical protein
MYLTFFHENKGKVVPEHAMKSDVGVEVQLHSFLTRKGLILSTFTARFNVTDLKSCTLNLRVFRLSFVKLRKTSISFVMSVRPSVWNNSVPTIRNCMKFGI